MRLAKEYLLVFILSQLSSSGLQQSRNGGRRRNTMSNSIQTQEERKKVACPKVRFRRRGCSSKYECKEVCEDKKQCKTTYAYKCKDFRRQECKNKWQNQCNGKGRKRRSSGRSPRRPFFLNTEVIYNSQDFPLQPSDTPFASPTQGQIFEFASPPQSRKCWQKVRDCKWVKYKSSCGNVPTTKCEEKTVKQCKRKCQNVYYCNKCPTKKPKPTKKPTKPVGPTQRPRPTTPRPSRPGPPSIPPPETFIGPPGTPIKQDVELVIDARNAASVRRRRKRLP